LPHDDSVSRWLDGLKVRDDLAIQRLWDHYFDRVVQLAGRKLPGYARRGFDEEDVALSAFHSLCERVGRGQYPELVDRDDLWRLLAVITARKAVSHIRNQTRQKRGGGRVLGESAVQNGTVGDEDGLTRFLSEEPTPQFAAEVAETYDRLLEILGDDGLRAIAVLKMAGHTVDEIAQQLGTTKRTVERRLGMIRMIWSTAASAQDALG
jgi:DNA-directed RNA polymerase specialized sigma24 family protein